MTYNEDTVKNTKQTTAERQEVMIMANKYFEWLDKHFDDFESWSDTIKGLADKFHITVDYADKVIDAYIQA